MLNRRQISSDDTRFPLAILFHDQGEPLLDLRFPLPLPFPVRDALDIRLTVTRCFHIKASEHRFSFSFDVSLVAQTKFTSEFSINFFVLYADVNLINYN